MVHKLMCRIGWHRWAPRSSPDGGRYVACKYCSKENSHISGAAGGGTFGPTM
jgi:hypothetical protein